MKNKYTRDCIGGIDSAYAYWCRDCCEADLYNYALKCSYVWKCPYPVESSLKGIGIVLAFVV